LERRMICLLLERLEVEEVIDGQGRLEQVLER
jgi:hypothetical protein